MIILPPVYQPLSGRPGSWRAWLAGWLAGFRNFPPVLGDANLPLGTDGKWKWYVNKHIKQTNKPKTAATRVKDVGKKVATDPPQVLEEARRLAGWSVRRHL